jgi:hypothetical protein
MLVWTLKKLLAPVIQPLGHPNLIPPGCGIAKSRLFLALGLIKPLVYLTIRRLLAVDWMFIIQPSAAERDKMALVF